jgi:hypothetical protein
MRLTKQEMVEAAEDLRTIIEAGLVTLLSAERLRRLRENPPGSRSAPWQVQVEADNIARLASATIGGNPRQWNDAALAAIGYRDREDVCIEVVREMAERVRQGQSSEQPDDSQEDRCEPASRRRRASAEPSSKKDCPIRSTLGNRNRKRGSR